eukprot:22875-Pelagococcus_subviridis.AAC.5
MARRASPRVAVRRSPRAVPALERSRAERKVYNHNLLTTDPTPRPSPAEARRAFAAARRRRSRAAASRPSRPLARSRRP